MFALFLCDNSYKLNGTAIVDLSGILAGRFSSDINRICIQFRIETRIQVWLLCWRCHYWQRRRCYVVSVFVTVGKMTWEVIGTVGLEGAVRHKFAGPATQLGARDGLTRHIVYMC